MVVWGILIGLTVCMLFAAGGCILLFKKKYLDRPGAQSAAIGIGAALLSGVLGAVITVRRGTILCFTMERGEVLPAGLKAGLIAAGCFCAVLCVWMAVLAYRRRELMPIGKAIYRHRGGLISAGIALASILLMLRYASFQSLWWDDMCQVGMNWKTSSLGELIQNCLNGDNMPPLYHVLAAIWLRVAPYGTFWLKLPSVLAVGAGIALCGLCGCLLKGPRMGTLTCLFAAVSNSLIINCGYAFRSYGFYFLFSALVMYAYFRRYQQGREASAGSLVFLGISMILLAYTHYFGILLCGALFTGDILLWLRKKIKPRCVLSYGMAAAAFIPWGLYALSYILNSMQSFWPPTPNRDVLKATLRHFVGKELVIFSYAVFAAYAILLIMHMVKRKSWKEGYLAGLQFWCIFVAVGLVYVYSAFLRPQASAFVDRYFYCLFPCVFILLAWAADKLLAGISALSAKTEKVVPVVLTVFVVFNAVQTQYMQNLGHIKTRANQRFEESADWLINQPDIYKSETMAILANDSSISGDAVTGWKYYLTRGGHMPDIDAREPAALTRDALQSKDTLYFFRVHSNWISPETYTLLKNNGFVAVDEDKEVCITTYRKVNAVE